MKSKIMIFISLMFVSFMGFSQEIVVDQKDLPPELLEKIRAEKEIQMIDERIAQMGEWAGKGKEIGLAVREGLTAVKDVAVDFSETNVGQFTMILIAWEIVSDDVLQVSGNLVKGIILTFIMTIFSIVMIRSYFKTCIPRKVKTSDPGFFTFPKTYKLESPYYSRDSAAQAVHFVIWGVVTVILLLIMFA